MAIGATTNWYVRADGAITNGGGFDSAIASAGMNYCDRATPILSLADVVTNGTTTVTSATGGFTSAMIGNCVRITGDNYYFITAVASTNSITVDRNTGTGTGQTGNIGGAFVSLQNLLAVGSNSGIFTAPAIASPLQAGNTINLRGAGLSDPSVVDYDWTIGGYWGPVNGTTSGRVTLLGYNGRPLIKFSGLLINGLQYWNLNHIKFQQYSGAGFASAGVTNYNSSPSSAFDCIMDLNGNDGIGFQMQQVLFCEIRNTGGGAAGSGSGVFTTAYAGAVIGNYIHGLRGDGISNPAISAISRNIIAGCGRDGIRLSNNGLSGNGAVENNTCYSNTGSGINVTQAVSAAGTVILNNLLTNNTGNGLNFSVGTTAVNDSRKVSVDYNAFYSNTGGNYNAVSAGTHDVTLTGPPYVSTVTPDYGLNNTPGAGLACQGAGSPGAFPGLATTGYPDIGAVQHQGAGGSGGGGNLLGNGTLVSGG